MSREFSLAYLTIPSTNPVDQIRIAADAGYDFVSLRLIPMHLPSEPFFRFDQDQNLRHKIKQTLEENNIRLLDIELARVKEDVKVEDYEAIFSAAAELGATDVLSSIWSKDKAYYYNEFAKICDLAAKYSLRVNLEFVTFAGVTNLVEALNVLTAVERPNAYLMLDTLHAHRSGISAEEISKVERSKFGFIHLCDGPRSIPDLVDPSMIGVAREGRLYPGEGGIDLKNMLLAMPPNPISIELPNSKEMERRGVLGHASQCLIKAKQYFAENGIP